MGSMSLARKMKDLLLTISINILKFIYPLNDLT
jgi:hypothetical protein